ncbi:hypothetical protein BH09PAT2_BH09PAT2_01920 [soil metagenome]
MKKKIILLLFGIFLLFLPRAVQASDYNLYDFPITPPIPCNQLEPNPRINCPKEMLPIYQRLSKVCAVSYADFLTDPIKKHYWVEDPAITSQGKADERARQFLYWVVSTQVIEDAPVLNAIWSVSSLIALVGVILIAAIFGIGYIISQRTQYNFNIRIWPTVIKIGMMLLYIAFSSAIVFVLIQFSEILMKFFYENLGGGELFNIYFANPSNTELVGKSEQNYLGFVGCRDLNIRVKDGIDTEIAMLKLTNVTYYVMGTMLLLRKILLWFLLFVSPFLALLMPFVFIRNTGWIWIGVFFQWLFYGPFFTFFFGALAKIWKDGIPWQFDFTRTSVSLDKVKGFIPEGYVYPTGINIVYGGPAQRITSGLSRPIDAANNGSYIDTYAEYILTLIMLWAVTFFPWWLLRIFRDYCCEGIFAMKNILLAMYNQMQQNSNPPTGPIAPTGPTLPSLNLDLKTKVGTGIKVPIGNISNFATLRTGDIAKNLNLQATRISDVARAETNKQTRQTVNQNMSYLSNPVKATTPAERQQYMKLRAELFNRAIKNDTVARTMLASTSTSQIERSRVFKEILTTMPQSTKVTVQQITAAETKQSQQTIKNITNNYTSSISNNNSIVKNISNIAKTSQETVKNILQSYSKQTDQPITNVIKNIAQETKTSESTVKNVLNQSGAIGTQAKMLSQTKLTSQQTTKILDSIRNNIVNSQTTLEKIAGDTNVNQSTVKTYVSNVYNAMTKNEQNIQEISNQTGASQAQVKTIITSYSTKITNSNESPHTIINQIAKDTSTNTSTVQNVMNATNNNIQKSNIVQQTANTQNITNEHAQTIVKNVAESVNMEQQNVQRTTNNMSQTMNSTSDSTINNDQTTNNTGPQVEVSADTTVAKIVAEATNTSEAASKEVVQNIMATVVQNDTLVANIEQQTGLKKQQISNIINTYSQNIDQPAETIIQKISQSSGVKKADVRITLENISNSILTSNAVVEDVAKKEGMKTEEVANVIQSQMQLATAPEQNIEKTIQIPQSVSLEDYEEVKKMWMSHYEEGDVPVSENIQNRSEWIEHEIVFITNTLNKLLSTDEKLRQQGLDELGYLLPIFLINNLKGEELIVYLKAKLEAAKTTGLIIEHENKVREKITKEQDQDEEMFVDIKQGATEEKHLALDEDEEEENNAPKSIEDRVRAAENKLSDMEADSSDDETSNDSFSSNMGIPDLSSSLKTVRNAITKFVEIARSETNKEIKSETGTAMSEADRTRMLTTIPQPVPMTLEQITATETKQTQQIVKNVTATYTANVANNETIIHSIAQSTNTSQKVVRNILQSYSEHLDQPISTVINNIAQATSTEESVVRNVLHQAANIGNQARIILPTSNNQNINTEQTIKIINLIRNTALSNKSITENISKNTNVDQSTIKSYLSTLYSTVSTNEQYIQQIANQTGSSREEVKNIITKYYSAISNTNDSSEAIINQIAKDSNINASIVQYVMIVTNGAIQSSNTVNEVAAQKNISVQQAQSIVNNLDTTQSTQTSIYKSAIENISQDTNIEQSKILSFVSTLYSSVVENEPNIQQLFNQTGVPQEQVKAIINSYSTKIATVNESPQTIINQIARETNINHSLVEKVIATTNNMISTSDIIQSAASEQNISNEQAQTIIKNITTSTISKVENNTPSIDTSTIQNIIQAITSNDSIIQQMNQHSQVNSADIKTVLQSYSQNLVNNFSNIAQIISEQTNIETGKVQSVILNMSAVMQNNEAVIKNVGDIAKVDQQTVQKVFNAMSQTINNTSDAPLIEQINSFIVTPRTVPIPVSFMQTISQSINISDKVSKELIQNIMNSFIINDTLINNLVSQTGLNSQQITIILSTFSKNIDQPTTTIIEKISQSAGIPKNSVSDTIEKIADTILISTMLIQAVAIKEGIKEEEVEDVIQSQMQIAAAPEQNIEKTIQIPQSVSLEDYEEVKNMWMNHYENAEVPLSETIKDRYDWIEQEIVFITNTLNKLLSTDEKLRQEGLDELGYLLPIFLINNLTGEELIVYLKAKLEAAKAILAILKRENQLREQILVENNQNEEILVDIKPEAQNDNHMALEEDEVTKVKSVQEKLSSLETKPETSTLDSIKQKLEQVAEKNKTN